MFMKDIAIVLSLLHLCGGNSDDGRIRRDTLESAYSIRDNKPYQESAYSIPRRPTNQSYKPENVYSIRVPSKEGFVTKKPSEYEFQARPNSQTYNKAPASVYTIQAPEQSHNPSQPQPGNIYSLHSPYDKNNFGKMEPPQDTLTNVYDRIHENSQEEPEIPTAELSANPDPYLISIRRENIYKTDNNGPAIEPKPNVCEPTNTTYNDNSACKGQLLFHDGFDTLNPNKWRHDIGIPSKPDYEFLAYIQSTNNTFINNGILHIKPTLTEDLSSPDAIRLGKIILHGCTIIDDAESCERKASRFNILPPVLSSRLQTRNSFSFRYGKVEIVAKLPAGDWLFPELYLEPKENKYGPGYMSGRIVMGLIRANQKLIDSNVNEELGSKLLSAGCLYRTNEDFSENLPKYINKLNGVEWNAKFHKFGVIWTPESIEFFVDDKLLGNCKLPTSKFKRIPQWQKGTPLAPFDDQFYLTIGIGAGGIREFPKNVVTQDNHKKPWKNTGSKDVLTFWNDKDTWYKTWNEQSHLQVDSVKVFAL